MFERLTSRASRIVQLASEEMTQSRHDELDTVHLLLGMLREREGIAGLALTEYCVELQSVRKEHSFVRDELDVSMDAVEAKCLEEAAWLGHQYPGTEHLLLAICCLSSSRASRLLLRLGHHPVQFCSFVLEVLGHGEHWEKWLRDHDGLEDVR